MTSSETSAVAISIGAQCQTRPDFAQAGVSGTFILSNVTKGEENMSRSAFLIFTPVVAIIYGLGLVLVPAMVSEMPGLASRPATSLRSRYFGVALLGIAVMAWLARGGAHSRALRPF